MPHNSKTEYDFNTPEHCLNQSQKTLRLRERFMAERNFDNFDDAEILTTILSYAGYTSKAAWIARRLLINFGNLKSVFEARPEQLLSVQGVNETAAGLISMAIPLMRTWILQTKRKPEEISNIKDAASFCKSLLIGKRVENFYVVALNSSCKVIGCRRIGIGSLSEVNAYPRIVVETALNYNAHSVLFCHNHPGGTCSPSKEDIASTIKLQELLGGLGILVLDHIIVAGAETYSMIAHNDIDYRLRTKSSEKSKPKKTPKSSHHPK